MRTFELKHAPAYTALSYEWGAADRDISILVEDARLTIRRNLHDFLTAYASVGDRTKWLWIDQITIDQSNIGERSAQVAIMTTVYNQAEEVLVWLGRDPLCVDICHALDLMAERPFEGTFIHRRNSRAALENKVGREKGWKAANQLMKDSMKAAREIVAETLNDDQVDLIIRFARNPYWRRLWIVQELAYATHLKVFCSSIFIDWHTCSTACEYLIMASKISEDDGEWNDKRFKSEQLHPLLHLAPLMVLINQPSASATRSHSAPGEGYLPKWFALTMLTLSRKCKDVRDMIYVLQGLMPASLRVQVNYKISKRKLFVQAAARYICEIRTPWIVLDLGQGLEFLALSMRIRTFPIADTAELLKPGLLLPPHEDKKQSMLITGRCEYHGYWRASDATVSTDEFIRVARLIVEEFLTGTINDELTAIFAAVVITPAQQTAADWSDYRKQIYARDYEPKVHG